MKTVFINGRNFKIFVEIIENMSQRDSKVMIRMTGENLFLIAVDFETGKKVIHVLNNGFFETLMQEPTEEFETQVDVEAFGEVLVDINTFVTQVSDFVEVLSEADPENGVHIIITGRKFEVSLAVVDPEHYYFHDTATIVFNT